MSKFVLVASGAIFCAANSHALVTVYSETFDPAPTALIDFNMQLGGDPLAKPANTKILALDQWGLTSNGSIINIGGANGNVLQPQLDTKQNGRMAAIFINPSHFAATGAGRYRLTFDVIAASSAGAGRVYLGAGSGYDLSAATDAKLYLPINPEGFGVRRATGEILWPALTGLNGAAAYHLITTTTEWILTDGTQTGQFREAPGAPFDTQTTATNTVEFQYDGTSTIVLAFGGYDTDVKIDNITIDSLDSGGGDNWAGWPIIDGRFVDTGSFLGLLEISADPWQYCYNLGNFIYLPESQVVASGGWLYVAR